MMFTKREMVISLVVLLAVGLIVGCGSVLKESGGDQTGTGGGLAQTATYVGLQNCYTCHNQTIFNKWAKSRHANFDMGNGTRVDYATMFAVGTTQSVTFDQITGDPGPHLASDGTDRCAPCHTGPDYGGDILDINVGGDVFTNPDIGRVSRSLVDCEACHGGGSLHYGVGALPYPQPAYAQCTLCHADAATEHHSVTSKYSWANSVGVNVGSNVATASTATGLEVWQLPDYLTSWTGTYAGPYFYNGDHTINDTHFNEFWIANEGDMLTKFASANAKLGYVNLDDDTPAGNTGMVNSNDPESCTASCHKAHEFDLTINKQWAAGAHHPAPEGPVIGGTPAAPANWGAVEHGFSASCLRCHSSMGFAELNGAYGDAPQTFNAMGQAGGYITCNACHDGVNNPTAVDKHLRFTGEVSLFNYDGSAVLATVNAGDSAVCIYCHQGREDMTHVDADIAASSFRFRNMHYLAAGAVQYAVKGYQYPGKNYNVAQFAHASPAGAGNCVGCHMNNPDPAAPSENIGGHTFYNSYGGTDNVGPCQACHPGVTAFDQISAGEDWDGNGLAQSAEVEIQGLRDQLLAAIEAYDQNPADSTPDVFHQEAYPYFIKNTGQSFDAALAKATFNWQFIYKDPGAFAHNGRYAGELLRDSIENLTGTSLGGSRP